MYEFTVLKNTSKIYYNGSAWESNRCGQFKILAKSNKAKINRNGTVCYPYYLCEFPDRTVIIAHYDSIKHGMVVNPYYPSVYGVGYIGIGDWKPTINRRKTKEYMIWSCMLQRCYSDSFQIRNPQYRKCSVDPRWFCFQTFCKDIMLLKNYRQWKENDGWEFDKDYKVFGNTIYSKFTCMFLLKTDNLTEMNQRKIQKKVVEK